MLKALIREILYIMQSLSIPRLFNLLRLAHSYARARFFKKVKLKGFPSALSVEPTTSCNLHCPECPSGLRSFQRPEGNMDITLFQKIIEEIQKHLIYITLYFQGEPYLSPPFFKMVELATQKRIFTATSTNAHFLGSAIARKTVESGLKKLIISLDGTTQETYSLYRKGGNIERVLQGIRNIVAAKKQLKSHSPVVVLQFIVFRHNEHQMEDFKKLAKSLEVDYYEFKSAQVYNFKAGNKLIPEKTKYTRYEAEADGYRIKSNLPNYCRRIWFASVVTQNGMLAPCCFDKQAEHSYGNVSKQNFHKVWQSAQAIKFRKVVFTQRKQFEICRNCSEGLKN